MKTTVILLIASAVIATTAVACKKEKQADTKRMLLCFTPYTIQPMDRGQATVVNLADIVTKLDVWICQGGDTIAVHQTTSDADFGTVSVMLDRTKTYTLHAVGHKANGAAVISDEIIRFPEEKVTHSMYCSTTFSPANTTNLTCQMQRIVGMFKLIVQDEIPDNVDHFKFCITTPTGTRWNTATMEATNLVQREAIPTSMNPGSNGYVTFNIFIMGDNLTEQKDVDITVQAIDGNGGVVKERGFENVPVKDGWVATYQGEFFTDTWMIITFDCDGWEQWDAVNING